ncbi:hypothetical protein HGRIS_007079 [Hohenbuehelia grisea]
MADALLVWRAWAICDRDYRVIIFPCLNIAALTATSTMYLVLGFKDAPNVVGSDITIAFDLGLTGKMRPLGICVIVLSTVTNVFLTSVIAVKLVMHQRLMRSVHAVSHIRNETIVIIQSGAIYSLVFIVYMILFITGRRVAVGVMTHTLVQLAGIVPTLIIVTISAGIAPITTKDLHRSRRMSSIFVPHLKTWVVTEAAPEPTRTGQGLEDGEPSSPSSSPSSELSPTDTVQGPLPPSPVKGKSDG